MGKKVDVRKCNFFAVRQMLHAQLVLWAKERAKTFVAEAT